MRPSVMATSIVCDLSFQDKVPDHVLRSDPEDEFTSDEDDEHNQDEGDRSGASSENSGAEEESDTEKSLAAEGRRNGNPGWADAMTKILKANKPRGKKSVVLARAKKLSAAKKKPPEPTIGFEIDGKTEEEKEKEPSVDPQTVKKHANPTRHKRTAFDKAGRIKPLTFERQRERVLSKIATKGVVQLFNAVRTHQKTMNEKLNEAGLERKKEKILQSVSKRDFLDMLMGPTAVKTKKEEYPEMAEPEESTPTWHVLRDDFMMGGTLKDWDKQDPAEQPSETKIKKRKSK